jgi:hypothetical protein
MNSIIQPFLTYGIILVAVVLSVLKTVTIFKSKNGQPGCNPGCPSCEAKHLTKEMIEKQLGKQKT